MSYFLLLNKTKIKNLKGKRFELIFIDIFCTTFCTIFSLFLHNFLHNFGSQNAQQILSSSDEQRTKNLALKLDFL
jgi:hypothetical protein